MKKVYIEPTMNIVKVQVSQMIAASPDGYEKNIDTTGRDGGSALGRSNNFDIWEDDEE